MLNKETHTQINVKEAILEHMFCAPRGTLGRVGGRLMSLDHGLPAWVLDLLEVNPSDPFWRWDQDPVSVLSLPLPGRMRDAGSVSIRLRPCWRWRFGEIVPRSRRGVLSFASGSLTRFPLDNATFDRAMTMNSLHLWPDPVAGLMEIRRVLRPGGRIAVAITRFSYASPDNFEQLLNNSGFTEVRTYTGDAGNCAIGQA